MTKEKGKDFYIGFLIGLSAGMAETIEKYKKSSIETPEGKILVKIYDTINNQLDDLEKE